MECCALECNSLECSATGSTTMERRRLDCIGMHPNGLHWTVVAWKSIGMQPNEIHWTVVARKSLGSSHVYHTGL